MEAAMTNTAWYFDRFTCLLSVLLIILGYYLGCFRRRKTAATYGIAIILLLLAESSPLHALAMNRYFSAHMIIHVVLLLVCGPLLVISLPENSNLKSGKVLKRISVFLLRYSWLAWITGVGLMWMWHIPELFDAAMREEHLLPKLQMVSLLLAGIVFSWPVIGPFSDLRIHPLGGIVYLAAACITCSLLGLLITFAPLGTYRHYLDVHMAGNPWHLTELEDQQAAGLIMWVPCCFVYLSGCLWLVFRWFVAGGKKLITEIQHLEELHGK